MQTDRYVKREVFYYIKISDIQTNRDNRISELFNDSIQDYYLGSNNKKVIDLKTARFWKDSVAPIRVGKKLQTTFPEIVFSVGEIDRTEFLEIMSQGFGDSFDYVCRRNVKMMKEEIKYLTKIKKDDIS